MPLLEIRQTFGHVSHSVVFADKPKARTEVMGRDVCQIAIPDVIAHLPLRVLARLFPVTGEGDEVSGPDAVTVRRGLAKAARRVERQRAKAGAVSGA